MATRTPQTLFADLQIAVNTNKGEARKTAVADIIFNLSGPDERFNRQKLAEIITGEKIPLVKCGISHLEQYVLEKMKPMERHAPKGKTESLKPSRTVSLDPNDAPLTPKVGLSVIRKQCSRKGEVTAVADGVVTVTLADGSIRKPNITRFVKLYRAA